MKVAVVNFSGNVGKSTLARSLLASRIPGAEVHTVETINSDGTTDDEVRGKEFAALHEALLSVDSAVVDIGASNVEAVLNVMRQFHDWHEDYDQFLVPTAPSAKQQRDTVATIAAHSEVGIPARKIVVVFNQVFPGNSVEAIFEGLFQYHARHSKFTSIRDAVVHENAIYSLLSSSQCIAELAADRTDYKGLIKLTTEVERRQQLAHQLSLRRLAQGVIEELDSVYTALFSHFDKSAT